MAEQFVARLTLTQQETAAVEEESEPGPPLFHAMDRLQTIFDDTLLLQDVGAFSDTPTADTSTTHTSRSSSEPLVAYEVRARTQVLLDTAYRRVAHFASLALRRLPIEGAEVDVRIRACLARLAHRDDLFRSVLAAFAETRAALLPDRFLRALTVGGPAPRYLPRPIEMHAHDPARYVSDMLAWVHQLLANERELIVSLLADLAPPPPSHAPDAAPPGHRRRIGERHPGLDGSIDWSSTAGPLLAPHAHTLAAPVLDALVRSVLNRNVAGCCRPLKTRVLQTLHAQRDAELLLRLYLLVRFYRATMRATIGASAALSVALDEMTHTAERTFLQALHAYYDAYLAHLATSSAADALDAIARAASLLRAVLAECAHAREADASEPNEADEMRALQRQILAHLVDPLRAQIAAYTARTLAAPESEGWTRYLRWRTPQHGLHACDTPAWHADGFAVQALVPLHVRIQRHSRRLRLRHTMTTTRVGARRSMHSSWMHSCVWSMRTYVFLSHAVHGTGQRCAPRACAPG